MRHWIALAQVGFVALVWSACSNNNNNSPPDAADDVAAKDAKADKAPIDAAQQEASTCGPVDVSSSTVTWTAPRAKNPSACSDQMIATYLDVCVNNYVKTTCDAFVAANAACQACLESTEGDVSFGAVIFTTVSQYIIVNTGGCIALQTGDLSGTGCGAKEWEATECEDMACQNCSVAADYSTCQTASDTGTCAAFINARCDLSDAGAAVAQCGIGGSFDQLFTGVATVMCGGYPADAGPPPSDASTGG